MQISSCASFNYLNSWNTRLTGLYSELSDPLDRVPRAAFLIELMLSASFKMFDNS